MRASSGAFRLAKKKGEGMNPCKQCIHFARCFERRGKCASYKTRKEVIAEIESINQKYGAPRSTRTESGVQEAPLAGDGDGQIHNSASVQL